MRNNYSELQIAQQQEEGVRLYFGTAELWAKC